MKIKARVESSPFFGGFGVYKAKKAYNLMKDDTWFHGSSLILHLGNRMLRVWRIDETNKS